MDKILSLCGQNLILQSLKSFEFRDYRHITFKFLNRICLPRGWGVKTNLLRIGKLETENFYSLNKFFHKILY